MTAFWYRLTRVVLENDCQTSLVADVQPVHFSKINPGKDRSLKVYREPWQIYEARFYRKYALPVDQPTDSVKAL